MHPSTDTSRTESLISTMCERVTTITRTLSSWMQEHPRSLAEAEQHVLRLTKDLAAALLSGLSQLAAPFQPPSSLPCPCGQLACYQRQRSAHVTTILGPISILRPYYLCRACGQGHHPLDTQLEICAGSRSAGLDELLALLGATQDSFAEAATVLERLTLVHVSPNSVRDATEELGATLVAHQSQAVARMMDEHLPPRSPHVAPKRLYVTMDGVLAHLHERGWSELKVGCCYQTDSRPERKRPDHLEVRAHSLSYVSALLEAERFGEHLWQEAARRGVMEAEEVVVVGDGAHWIWNIAQTQFPQATQVLDWYHASGYVWKAATALWGEEGGERSGWAKQQLDRLWDGKVGEVLNELNQHVEAGEGVKEALSYYTTHCERMNYAEYRERGLQIGSGSIESGCKQVVSLRLKGAGMIWDASGAEEVAVVRAWLKSGRWEEAMRLRAVRKRGYVRKEARACAAEGMGNARTGARTEAEGEAKLEVERSRKGLPPDVLAQLRAEAEQDKGANVWRSAWSVKRQREQQAERQQRASTARAA